MSNNMFSLAKINNTLENSKVVSSMPLVLNHHHLGNSNLSGPIQNLNKTSCNTHELMEITPLVNGSNNNTYQRNLTMHEMKKRSRKPKHYHHHLGANPKIYTHDSANSTDELFEINTRSLERITTLTNSYSALITNNSNYSFKFE